MALTRLILLYLFILVLRGLIRGGHKGRSRPPRPVRPVRPVRPATRPDMPSRSGDSIVKSQDISVRPEPQKRRKPVRKHSTPQETRTAPTETALIAMPEVQPAQHEDSWDYQGFIQPDRLVEAIVFSEILAPPRARRHWQPLP
jgi:hypothetical protein